MTMNKQELAVEALRALAKIVANDKLVLFEGDWGFGTATLIIDDEHCHIGCDDGGNTDDENFEQFVFGLHKVLTDIASKL
jgi:hypothetical protein